MKVTASQAKPASAPVAPSMYVQLDNIVNHKELTYRTADSAHVDSLVADIKVNGLDVPLLTFAEKADSLVKRPGSPDPIPATYLVAGLHRRAALLKLRRDEPETFKKRFPNGIPVSHRVASLAEALLLQIRENVQRREMSAEEIFPILEKLSAKPYSMTGKEIAKKVGKSAAWVSQMQAVNEELDEETKSEVVTGKIAVGDARKIAAEVKASRKSGKPVTADDIKKAAADAKAKQAARLAGGAQRASGEDRRISIKKLWSRFKAHPKLSVGRENVVLRSLIAYAAAESNKLEPELRKDIVKPTVKPAAKTAKK